MLNPLGMMLVLLLAFSAIFGAGKSYAVYLMTGLVVWNFFSQATTSAMTQLAWGGTLLHRIYLPRVSFALSAVGTGLVNLLLSLIPLALVMAVTKTPLHPTLVLLPIAILLLAVFALGIGLLLSTLAVYFPDIVEMYQIALLGWMYLTPIIYPESIVPIAYRWWMFNLNPMYHLVKFLRLSLLYGTWPNLAEFTITAAIAVGVVFVGWIVFTRKADEFAYRT
jgi:ABC-type polysaccharide/polyol phosphate export permease